ncbi:hypothetical protein [Nostoc sp.]|uniref:hypothetical protein n=1 Tax=Nostoc sp. TaxID=1180 RepID=UPI002FF499F2
MARRVIICGFFLIKNPLIKQLSEQELLQQLNQGKKAKQKMMAANQLVRNNEPPRRRGHGEMRV